MATIGQVPFGTFSCARGVCRIRRPSLRVRESLLTLDHYYGKDDTDFYPESLFFRRNFLHPPVVRARPSGFRQCV